LCATTECSRRWTGELQAAARVWWNGDKATKDDDIGAPVAFSNFAPMCQAYRQPSEDEDHRELRPGEVNP
jgi:hypothetical protein